MKDFYDPVKNKNAVWSLPLTLDSALAFQSTVDVSLMMFLNQDNVTAISSTRFQYVLWSHVLPHLACIFSSLHSLFLIQSYVNHKIYLFLKIG